jgi:hypothetical protein
LSRAAYFREHYLKNREHQLARRRQWYADNRERALQVQADYKRRNAVDLKVSRMLGIPIAKVRELNKNPGAGPGSSSSLLPIGDTVPLVHVEQVLHDDGHVSLT